MAENKSHFDSLESILDQTSIEEVVKMLARICYEKAEHVETNWQDKVLARAWARNGDKLATVSEKLERTS